MINLSKHLGYSIVKKTTHYYTCASKKTLAFFQFERK